MTRPPRRPGGLGLLLALWALAWLLGAPLAQARSHRKKDKPPAGARPHHATGKPSAVNAEDRLETGLAALAAGRFSQAEESFLRAYGAEVRPELLYYLGRLARAQGQGLLARDLMRRYLQDPDREANPGRQALAQLLLDEPPPQGIQLVEVQIIGPRSAWVRVDNRLVGWLPLLSPLQLSAGAHTVSLEGSEAQLSTSVLLTPGFDSEVRFNTSARSVLSSAPPPLLTLMSGSAESGLPDKKAFSALRDAAAQEGLFLLSQSEALQGNKELASCLSTLPCQLDLGSRNDALGLLLVRIEPGGNTGRPQTTIQTEFIDGVAGRRLASHSQTCNACSEGELQERVVQTALRSYREGWLRPRARLQVTVSTPGARVKVGERLFAHLPLRLAPLPGSLALTASAPGHLPQQRSVDLAEGRPSNVDFTLQPGSAPLASRPPSPPPTTGPSLPASAGPSLRSKILFYGGLAALGSGFILGGFGVSALVVNGRCGPGSSTGPGELCPQIFDTGGKGGALLGIGLGLSVAGTVGIILGRDTIRRGGK